MIDVADNVSAAVVTQPCVRALLVEDEPLLLQGLKSELAFLWPALDTSRTASDGVEAVKLLSESMPDVVFLDIHLPGLNGLDIAKLISGRCHVVFITAFPEHAPAAFDQGVLDYVVKPITRERMAVTIARVQQRITSTPADVTEALRRLMQRPITYIRWIQATVGNQIKLMSTDDIIYFQAEAKYTKVVSNRGEHHIRRAIKDLAENLDPNSFWQIHRGTIVKASQIEAINRNGEAMTLRLKGRQEKLSVSEPYQHLFKAGI